MTATAPNKTGIVLIDCPERKGIVAVVSDFLFPTTPISFMPTSIRTRTWDYRDTNVTGNPRAASPTGRRLQHSAQSAGESYADLVDAIRDHV